MRHQCAPPTLRFLQIHTFVHSSLTSESTFQFSNISHVFLSQFPFLAFLFPNLLHSTFAHFPLSVFQFQHIFRFSLAQILFFGLSSSKLIAFFSCSLSIIFMVHLHSSFACLLVQAIYFLFFASPLLEIAMFLPVSKLFDFVEKSLVWFFGPFWISQKHKLCIYCFLRTQY